MNAGACATDFYPFHAMRIIIMERYGSLDWIKKAGPAGLAVKFGLAKKKCGASDRVDKFTRTFFI